MYMRIKSISAYKINDKKSIFPCSKRKIYDNLRTLSRDFTLSDLVVTLGTAKTLVACTDVFAIYIC